MRSKPIHLSTKKWGRRTQSWNTVAADQQEEMSRLLLNRWITSCYLQRVAGGTTTLAALNSVFVKLEKWPWTSIESWIVHILLCSFIYFTCRLHGQQPLDFLIQVPLHDGLTLWPAKATPFTTEYCWTMYVTKCVRLLETEGKGHMNDEKSLNTVSFFRHSSVPSLPLVASQIPLVAYIAQQYSVVKGVTFARHKATPPCKGTCTRRTVDCCRWSRQVK